jgi:hypothetical protein
MGATGFTSHSPKHRFIDVLQWDVDITRDMLALGNRRDQLIAPVRRMGVKQSNPKLAVDLFNLAQERSQC